MDVCLYIHIYIPVSTNHICIDTHMPNLQAGEKAHSTIYAGERLYANRKGIGMIIWRPWVQTGINNLSPNFRSMHYLGTFEKITVGKNILKMKETL